MMYKFGLGTWIQSCYQGAELGRLTVQGARWVRFRVLQNS